MEANLSDSIRCFKIDNNKPNHRINTPRYDFHMDFSDLWLSLKCIPFLCDLTCVGTLSKHNFLGTQKLLLGMP